MPSFMDLLLPPACAGCDRTGTLLCESCLLGMRPPADGSEAFVSANPGVVMGNAMVLGMGAFAYAGSARRALSQLKYSGAARIAAPLARAAGPAFNRLLQISGPAVLVPVPVHPERRRQRGYNQAAVIAGHLARPRRLDIAELLDRGQATERQHRLDRAARLRNLRGAISVRPGRHAPAIVIVIDDILTTSATLEACASVLSAAGVGEVYGFAIARET